MSVNTTKVVTSGAGTIRDFFDGDETATKISKQWQH